MAGEVLRADDDPHWVDLVVASPVVRDAEGHPETQVLAGALEVLCEEAEHAAGFADPDAEAFSLWVADRLGGR